MSVPNGKWADCPGGYSRKRYPPARIRPLLYGACRYLRKAVAEQVAGMTILERRSHHHGTSRERIRLLREDKGYVSQIRDIVRANYRRSTVSNATGRPTSPERTPRPGMDHELRYRANIDQQFAPLKKLRPDSPLMCSEFWSGWFDKWGANHETRPAADMIAGIDEMLSKGISFSLPRRTNWGHWAGANSPDSPLT